MLTLCQATMTTIPTAPAPLPVLQGASLVSIDDPARELPRQWRKSLHNHPQADTTQGTNRSMTNRSEDRLEIWDIATAWVDQIKGLILQVSDPYLHRGPYERSDFVNAAYLAAYEALESCVTKKELQKFLGYFFMIFRRRCLEDFGLQKSVIITAANRSDLDTCRIPSDAFHPLNNLVEDGNCADEMKLFKTALTKMTRRQQRAWSILLGLDNVGLKNLSPGSVAKFLDISEKGLQRLLRRSLNRLSRRNLFTDQERPGRAEKKQKPVTQNVPHPPIYWIEQQKRPEISRSL